MDMSVRKLSEILKIDPEALLEKMIQAGLPQNNIDDAVSNDDKQILLSFIRSSKTTNISQASQETVVKPKPPTTVTPRPPKTKKAPRDSKPKDSKAEVKEEIKTKIKTVNINGSIRVNDLSRKISRRGNEVIKKLMELGEMVSLNEEIDQETAVLVAEEFGFTVKYEEEQNVVEEQLDYPIPEIFYQDEAKAPKRHPVVTVMGHVDHGKTSLLDAIKSTNVVDGESGGITQHLAAYEVQTKTGIITFIDTPGHEAFSAMRARGANTTDIVILVVAANDSVKPQTIEAITHAKSAKVPIIVAVNKIDLDGADIEKVKGDLSKHDLVSEDWGGKIQVLPISALKKEGIDELLDAVHLESEIQELKSPVEGLAQGIILESELDRFKGPLSTLLVQKGLLKHGDVIVAGEKRGKIKTLTDSSG